MSFVGRRASKAKQGLFVCGLGIGIRSDWAYKLYKGILQEEWHLSQMVLVQSYHSSVSVLSFSCNALALKGNVGLAPVVDWVENSTSDPAPQACIAILFLHPMFIIMAIIICLSRCININRNKTESFLEYVATNDHHCVSCKNFKLHSHCSFYTALKALTMARACPSPGSITYSQ